MNEKELIKLLQKNKIDPVQIVTFTGKAVEVKVLNVNTTTVNTTTAPVTTSELDTDTKGLDICLNYQKKQGITLLASEWQNTVEGTNLVKGELLHTWTYYASQCKTTIRDASNYSDSNDAGTYTTVKNNNYNSLTNGDQKIDLFYNTTANFKTMYNDGEATN